MTSFPNTQPETHPDDVDSGCDVPMVSASDQPENTTIRGDNIVDHENVTTLSPTPTSSSSTPPTPVSDDIRGFMPIRWSPDARVQMEVYQQQQQQLNHQNSMREPTELIDTAPKFRSTIVDSLPMQKTEIDVRTNLLQLLFDNPPSPADVPAAAVHPAMPSPPSPPRTSDPALTKHRSGCRNENPQFVDVRRMCPYVSADELWDLFVQCGGDANWTLDIVYSDEHIAQMNGDSPYDPAPFECECDRQSSDGAEAAAAVAAESEQTQQRSKTTASSSPALSANRTLSLRERRARHASILDSISLERTFRYNDAADSAHVRFLREQRHGAAPAASFAGDDNDSGSSEQRLSMTAPTPILDEPYQQARRGSSSDGCSDTGNEASRSEGNRRHYIKVHLDIELIDQLERTFGVFPLNFCRRSDDDGSTAVMLPKRLARKVYALWLESLYHEQDEQLDQSYRASKSFDRDMEVAMRKAQELTEAADSALTRLDQHDENALIDQFPQFTGVMIERLHDWQQCYGASVPTAADESAMIEQMRSLAAVAAAKKNQDCAEWFDRRTKRSTSPESSILPDEVADKAKQTYEDYRAMSKHHNQMHSECINRGRAALVVKDIELATYFSDVAFWHYNEQQRCCQISVNAMKELHASSESSDSSLLDLHYFFKTEAAEMLDVFLDAKLRLLRRTGGKRLNVRVITGRGLHSTNGYPIIKLSTIEQLQRRKLRWVWAFSMAVVVSI